MRFHRCKRPDERGSLEGSPSTCGNCGRTWCDNCDPAPAALCPWCHGYGYSSAPLRAAIIGGVTGYVNARRRKAARVRP